MNCVLVLVLFLIVSQSAAGAEVLAKANKESERYAPYEMEMSTGALKFLNGSWSYNDEHVRIMETWSTNNDGESIGIRKLLHMPGRASDETYDIFTVDNSMRIRRMDMSLNDVGKSGFIACSSKNKNKVTLTQPNDKDASKFVPLQTINYASPNDNELDLEIISSKNGKDTREFYKLTRTK